MTETSAFIPVDPEKMPAGQYAIVEVIGHRTLIGRIAEVNRFGTAMLMVEPLFANWMLGPVWVGGGSLYQVTECSAAAAWDRRPKYEYELPSSLAAVVAEIPPLGNALPAFLGFSVPSDFEDDSKGGDL
ncbi:MAG: hypothetical protein P4L68_08090 [Methylovirgula sp.]|nr:hypothetical protein [Methylovirgula sp.]